MVAPRMKLGAFACAALAACGGGSAKLPPAVEAVPVASACARSPSTPALARRVSRSPFVGPTRPTAEWIHRLRSHAFGFSVDAEATAFVSIQSGIVAVGRDGSVQWTHAAAPEPLASPTIGPDGAVYVELLSDLFDPINLYRVGRGGVQRLDACGQTVWMAHAPPQNGSTPKVSADGTVYFAGHDRVFERPEEIVALGGDGTIAWSRMVSKGDTVTGGFDVGADGSIYYGTANGFVTALDRNGTVRWSTPFAHQIIHSVTVGDDGREYAMLAGSLVVLDSEGRELWSRTLLPNGALPPPVIAEDGTVYVGGRGLTSIGPDGLQRWHTELDGFVASPVLSQTGTLFVGVADMSGQELGSVYAVAPDGGILWRYRLEPAFDIALAQDRVLYVAAGNRLYAIGECTGDLCEDDGSSLPSDTLLAGPR